MKNKCETLGHVWMGAQSPGWFCCQQVIDMKYTKRHPSGQAVYCSAVAHCPGCLGYVLQGEQVVMCQAHSCVNIQLLPVMPSTRRQSFSSWTVDQHSLF